MISIDISYHFNCNNLSFDGLLQLNNLDTLEGISSIISNILKSLFILIHLNSWVEYVSIYVVHRTMYGVHH